MTIHTHENPNLPTKEIPLSTEMAIEIEKIETYEEKAQESLKEEDEAEADLEEELVTFKEEIQDVSEKEDNDNFYKIEEIELEPIVEEVVKMEEEEYKY